MFNTEDTTTDVSVKLQWFETDLCKIYKWKEVTANGMDKRGETPTLKNSCIGSQVAFDQSRHFSGTRCAMIGCLLYRSTWRILCEEEYFGHGRSTIEAVVREPPDLTVAEIRASDSFYLNYAGSMASGVIDATRAFQDIDVENSDPEICMHAASFMDFIHYR